MIDKYKNKLVELEAKRDVLSDSLHALGDNKERQVDCLTAQIKLVDEVLRGLDRFEKVECE